MRSRWFFCAAFAAATTAAYSQPPQFLPKAGDEYEIEKSYETFEKESDGSSSSSSGHNTVRERVIAVRADGLELEYDLPQDASAEDRARDWKFPARVFRSADGQLRLLNSSQLEERLEAWLKSARWDRHICGRWIFTWNAFRIDCDPQSVIPIIQSYDLRSADLRDGALFKVPEARSSGTLTKRATRPDGSTFVAVMDIDPEVVRRARAEADVAVGEIMQKPLTLEAALRQRTNESIAGTVSITIDTDAAGNVRRRIKVIETQSQTSEGHSETRTATETVERRLVSRSSVPQ